MLSLMLYIVDGAGSFAGYHNIQSDILWGLCKLGISVRNVQMPSSLDVWQGLLIGGVTD